LLALPILGIAVLLIALWIYSIVWAAGDASRRGKSGLLVGLLVLFVHPWPLGLVLWLIFRPEERQYRIE
jgi:hypothetical protein